MAKTKQSSTIIPTDDDQAATNGNGEQDIAMLAYSLWQSRGCPDGSSEADWYSAQEELRQSRNSPAKSQAAAS
jgi:hypothetical protein